MGFDIPKRKIEKGKESKATVQDGPRAAYEAINDRLVKMGENKRPHQAKILDVYIPLAMDTSDP